MEIVTEFAQSQFLMVVPVILAVGACVLLFIYSIRPAQQPKFKLGFEDKKSVAKKKKPKEKKPALNGQATTNSTKSDKSPSKEVKKSPESVKKEKKPDSVVSKKPEAPTKPQRNIEVSEKKKGNKKPLIEKPVDFDDGNWETVPTKGDKKKKVEQPLSKKEKKQKQVKETEAEQPQQDSTTVENVIEEPVIQAEPEAAQNADISEPDVVPIVEEKKEKPKKQKVKKATEPKPAEVIEPVAAPEPEPEKLPAPVAPPSGAVFDELGDTWTEAKPVKKSKKKARRDN